MCAGQHAIVEVNGPIASLPSSELLVLMERSAQAAGATIIDRHWHQFGEGQGCTAVLLLAESHLSVHTWPEHEYAAFDIFMCGETKIARAIGVLREACQASHSDIFNQQDGERFYAKVIRRGRRLQNLFCPETIAEELQQLCPLLITKISDVVKLSEHKAFSLLTELVKFLVLCSRSSQVLLPSLIVNSAWQQFLLFSENYENFCQQYLSRFVHYQPAVISEGRYLDYQNTLAVYNCHYGSPPARFWPRDDFFYREHGSAILQSDH